MSKMKLAKVLGYVFPLGSDGLSGHVNAGETYKQSLKRERKLFRRLQKAESASEFRGRSKLYFFSFAARFVALVDQAKELPEHSRQPISAYRALAMNVLQPAAEAEAVRTWLKPKSDGSGHRSINDFGPLQRAAQRMVTKVLSIRFKPRHFQFGVPGRGREEAVRLIKLRMRQGYDFGLILDVKNFFNSFNREALTQLLPLPSDVTTRVVAPLTLNLKPTKGSTTHTKHPYPINSCPSHTVLPQGSLCSSIVAAFVVSQMTFKIPPGVTLVVYVDDICVLAKNEADLIAAKEALLLGFQESAAGKFEFEISEESPKKGGLEFLGYLFWIIPGTHKLLVQPTFKHSEAFKGKCGRFQRQLRKAASAGANKQVIRELVSRYWAYQISWSLAFRAASKFVDILYRALKRLLKVCEKYRVSIQEAQSQLGTNWPLSLHKFSSKFGGYKEQVKIGNFKLPSFFLLKAMTSSLVGSAEFSSVLTGD